MRPWILAAVALLMAGCEAQKPDASLVSESKDGRYRVSLVELPAGIDRNFDLILDDMKAGSKTNIFRSPDEGRPIGTERIIWSGDHEQFLLVGRHFLVEKGPWIPIDTLYLLYDTRTGKLWCNAAQYVAAPRFTMEDLRGWTGNYENDVFRMESAKGEKR